MDIDFVLRSFRLPADHPDWEARLLSRLNSVEGTAAARDRGGDSVVIPFPRPFVEPRRASGKR